MYRSESIVHNLLREVDSLSMRITNIMQAYCNTAHLGLRERLFFESKIISFRLNEILSTAKMLNKRTKESISLSSLLIEKCQRTISQKDIEKNLFFL